MDCTNPPPFMVFELPDITDSINYPLQSGQRIKYTCFDVSRSMIAFGATSGGIYVFNRNPCEFVQLIPNKDGPITRLAISTDEKHIAFANGRGVVTVTECDSSCSHSATSKEHHGNEVTAMLWGSNMLFTGDDVGKVAVLQLHNFITKTIFQSSSQTIMCLDSRICQLDVKDCMLLVSTLTRCYICDTLHEQYRQIGQKLRDGEFGACFVNSENIAQNIVNNTMKQFTEAKQYNIVDEDAGFAIGKELQNTLIYCARPSSRLWEASIDGMVRRTHQFKQILGRSPTKLTTPDSYNNENISVKSSTEDYDGQSVNFSKLMNVSGAIFSFKRDALYFLNVQNVDNTIWLDAYKDIIECRAFHDTLYIWLANGSLVSLNFMKIEKFLVKCYLDEKYVMCAELCALFSDYLLFNLTSKLHILVGLRDKLQNNSLITKIETILSELDSIKKNEASQIKAGIHVVDNTYQAQTSLFSEELDASKNNDNKYKPEAIQAFKDLSLTVSDKLNTSKKILKEKWEDFEGKMKNLGDKQHIQEVCLPKRIAHENQIPSEYVPIEFDNDIVYKKSSQKAIEIDNNILDSNDKVCKSLYQYYRLSLLNKEAERSNLVSIIENYACDIKKIFDLMLVLEQYCISVNALDESKFVPNNIFLLYLETTPKKDEMLDVIIKDEDLYKYFVDSCISVNMKSQKLSNLGCECGYPLPYTKTNQMPAFTELIDEFIERQWSSQTRDQCYEICKRMPYLWKKILYLRRNEDLLNVLRLLLQILDENLLHSFLPQFTLDTWDRAIILYSTLHANICLNCNKKFEHISVKDMLSWDDLGALIIKSVGSKNAVGLLCKHAELIDSGEITMKFYHTCLMVALYAKIDVTIADQLIDTIYSSYDCEDSRKEIWHLLEKSNGQIKNTALPIIVAANSPNWGLNKLSENHEYVNLKLIIDNLSVINNGNTDCLLCGLPLQNEVLIQDGGLWTFKCGHTFHGACLELNKVKLCPACSLK